MGLGLACLWGRAASGGVSGTLSPAARRGPAGQLVWPASLSSGRSPGLGVPGGPDVSWDGAYLRHLTLELVGLRDLRSQSGLVTLHERGRTPRGAQARLHPGTPCCHWLPSGQLRDNRVCFPTDLSRTRPPRAVRDKHEAAGPSDWGPGSLPAALAPAAWPGASGLFPTVPALPM